MKNPQKPAKSIDSYLVNLIEQSVKSALQQKSLQEKEKQLGLHFQEKHLRQVQIQRNLKCYTNIIVNKSLLEIFFVRQTRNFKHMIQYFQWDLRMLQPYRCRINMIQFQSEG